MDIPMPEQREEALVCLAQERVYQTKLWGDNPHSILEFLCYIRDYTEEAMHSSSRLLDSGDLKEELLNSLRKIGALTVAAMEQHGCNFRDMNDLRFAEEDHDVQGVEFPDDACETCGEVHEQSDQLPLSQWLAGLVEGLAGDTKPDQEVECGCPICTAGREREQD